MRPAFDRGGYIARVSAVSGIGPFVTVSAVTINVRGARAAGYCGALMATRGAARVSSGLALIGGSYDWASGSAESTVTWSWSL